MKRIVSLLLILVVRITMCYIIETDSIESIVNYIDLDEPDILVIFDIDNTLARPSEELSSDEWFCYLVNKRMMEGYDYLTSIYYVLPIVYYAQFNVWLEPTESIVPFLVQQLMNHKIPVMALTTRSLFVAERTMEQLERINIAFLVSHISQDSLVLLGLDHPCFYNQSILFSGNNDKGEALVRLFEIMNYFPKKVIFVDDKLKYLLSVEKILKDYNISFIGIRYSGCDERVHNFNPDNAEMQWNKLRKNNFLP
jgi:hypothetical protein